MAPKKNQKMALGDFLNDQSLGSWADEMEDMPLATESRTGYGGERRAFTAPGMGERSFSNRGFATREQLPLPSRPPYTAHLGNLSFDATEGDVHDFFQDCGVAHVRIVEDKMEHKPKGFGYVEFSSLDGLKKALEKDGGQFQGRSIRLSVADPPKDRPEARELTDWTRKGPLPDLPNNQRRPSEQRGFNRGGGYEAAPGPGAGPDRSARRQPTFNDDAPPREINWERRGPLPPMSPPAGGPPSREGGRMRSQEGQTPRERKLSPAWGEGTNRSQDGSRPPRGEFRERPTVERAPTAAEMDNQWRARMKPDAPQKSATPTPEPSAPSSPAQPAMPATRPKLNLQKRTVSEAQPSPVSASESKASPFGAARPIDTAAKEREIEEKRQLTLRQKKEADDKAREERKAKAEKEKAERAAASKEGVTSPVRENGKADSPTSNGEEKAPAKSYEILRRATEDNAENGEDEDEEEDGEDAPANVEIVQDKAVKPKEVVRDPPRGPSGAWRKASTPNPAAASDVGPTADDLEGDGWSTVPKKTGKNRGRGGNQGARAIAS